MKTYIFAALIALISIPAYADGISCAETAKMISDYEKEKKAGGMNKVRADTVNGVLSATRKSYASACKGQNSRSQGAK